jgi:hypothetical protein
MQMADPGGSGYTKKPEMAAPVHAKQRIWKLKRDWA